MRDAEPIGPAGFAADTVRLFASGSGDRAGGYRETLRWDLLRSWRLA